MIPPDSHWHTSGDAQANAIGCWYLALEEIRRKLRLGEFALQADENRIAQEGRE